MATASGLNALKAGQFNFSQTKEVEIKVHKKRVKKRPSNLVTKEGLRFEEGTPVEMIQVKPEGVEAC